MLASVSNVPQVPSIQEDLRMLQVLCMLHLVSAVVFLEPKRIGAASCPT